METPRPTLNGKHQEELEVEAREASERKYLTETAERNESGRASDGVEGSILTKMVIKRYTNTIIEYLGGANTRGRRETSRDFLTHWKGREEVVAYIVLREILNSIATDRNKLTRTASTISKDLGASKQLDFLEKTAPTRKAYTLSTYEQNTKKFRDRKLLREARKISEGSEEVLVGTVLLELLINSGADLIKIETIRRTKYITLTVNADAVIHEVQTKVIDFSTHRQPLIEVPRPHTTWIGSGGYITYKDINLIRDKDSRDRLVRDNFEYPSRLVAVVNKISETPWKINKTVLDVIEHVVNTNLVDESSPSDYPFLYGGLPYMDSLDAREQVPKELEEDYDPVAEDFKTKQGAAIWYQKVDAQKAKNNSNISKKIMLALVINLATKYREAERFYYSYSLDFRGRLYPIQTILTPQGTGYVKSLLLFADGVEYTERVEYWIKIHTANSRGLDKLPYEGRIEAIDNLKGEILEIYKDPKGNAHLWKDVDSPFLYLASCLDYGAYLAGDSSHCFVPISLDATCSGIQIYSGLLKDKIGGQAVNVINNDTGEPSDIYKMVAEKVNSYLEAGDYPKEFIYKDSAGIEHTESTELEANSLKGKVTRKYTKRNTMTVPYSVTKRGMFKQLEDIFKEEELLGKQWWQGSRWVLTNLLTQLNDRAIGEIVKGAKVGQEFLKKLVRHTNGLNEMFVYYTPILRFPVIQNIRVNKKKRVKTPFGNVIIVTKTDKINSMKQSSGVAPNFIHSLDATLMYLTVEKLIQDGVSSFMLIHDSFGVPASQVDMLNTRIRESFIELFETNPLEDLIEQVGSGDDVNEVMLGDLDLKDVTNSNYIFS